MMIERQSDMKVPSDIIPYCPHCGSPMIMNLRCDQTFVQDKGWYKAQNKYQEFIISHKRKRVLYLELGVGNNTPIIIKYPFIQAVERNKKATYVSINNENYYDSKKRFIYIRHDIHQALEELIRLED